MFSVADVAAEEEFNDLESESEAEEATPPVPIRASLSLTKVCFAYRSRPDIILNPSDRPTLLVPSTLTWSAKTVLSSSKISHSMMMPSWALS